VVMQSTSHVVLDSSNNEISGSNPAGCMDAYPRFPV